MAIPTITAVSPAVGPAGGRNVVTVAGTGFRLSANLAPAVKVQFAGIDALTVAVLSDTELRVGVPEYAAKGTAAREKQFPPIDVRAVNLDDAGLEIGIESTTKTKAYAYKRSAIRDPRATQANQIYRQIIHEVIHTFQRQIVHNVAIGTSVDYGLAGEAVIKKAKFPSITLGGPRVAEDVINRHHWNFVDYTGDGNDPEFFEGKWPAYVSMFEFDAILVSNRRRELYGMLQGLHELFMRKPYLEIPCDLANPNGPKNQFPFQLTVPGNVSIADPEQDLLIATSVFQVRRIPFRVDEPVALGTEILEGELQVHPIIDDTAPDLVPFADAD